MKQPARSWSQRLTSLLSSSLFFKGIVALFIVEAGWIALSGRYPMAFDEDFHLGIIRLYAHHLSPFWSGQPPHANVFGAVARDPSYLYHYLMSFPYRLLSSFTNNQGIIVLGLRVLNIALFASCLPLFRKLLLASGASRALVQSCLAVFILIPIVPLLAAQINYDNLLLPLVAGLLLLTVRFDSSLKRDQPLAMGILLQIVILAMLISLVKYAALPLVLGVAIYLGLRLLKVYGIGRRLWQAVGKGFVQINRPSQVALIVLLIIVGGLFGERYGVNVAHYHTPVPDCSKVLTIKQCSEYGPWIRDYTLSTAKDRSASKNPLAYTRTWLYAMWFRTFFAVDGPATLYETRGPLLAPGVGAIVFASLGAVAIVTWRRLLGLYNRRVVLLLSVVSLIYMVTLWLDEYEAFTRTGQPVAINGRYLLPIMLPLLLFGGLGLVTLLQKRPQVKIGLATIAFICLLWGGGALTYILRSNDNWYWHNSAVRTANHGVQHVLWPIVPGTNHPTQFLH